MKIEGIRKRHWGEWVLIEYSKPGDRLKVLGREPIGYSYNEEEG